MGAVNVLRGIVCLSVTALHFVFLLEVDGQQLTDWFLWVRPGVESFFVLTGYFLAASYRERVSDTHFSVPRLVARRLLRLLVPYWVALAGVYLLPAWRLFVPTTDPYILPAVGDVVANFACAGDLFARPPALFTFWSLATMIQLHVLWATAFWVVRWALLPNSNGRHHTRAMGVLQALVVLATMASWWWAFAPGDPASGSDVTTGWRLPAWFLYAGVGCISYWAVGRVLWRTTLLIFVVGLLAGAGVSSNPRATLAAVAAVVLFSISVRPVSLSGWVWQPLSAVGRWSYSVYLVHGIVGYRVMTALSWGGLTSPAVRFIGAVVASLAAGWIFYRLIEAPVLRWVGGIRYRGERSPALAVR